MGRAKELSATDVRAIQELRAQGMKMKTIAARVGRSVASVSRVSSGTRAENANFRSGRPKRVTERLARQIVWAISVGNVSAAQAQASVNARVSVRAVQRTLQEHPDMNWKKMKHRSIMNAAHMKNRLMWATEKADWGVEEWSKVVFSDEKKWNLGGPDGLKSYWHNSKLPERAAVKRHSQHKCVADTYMVERTAEVNTLAKSEVDHAAHVLLRKVCRATADADSRLL